MQNKECRVCAKIKSITEFSKDSITKDKYRYCCKICDKEKRKKAFNLSIDERKKQHEVIQVSYNGKKTCPKCLEIKNLTDFIKHLKYKDGLTSFCRNCLSNSGLEWGKNNPDKRLILSRRNNLTRNKQKAKDTKLKRLYNISLEKYNEICKQQDNKCIICKKEETARDGKGGTKPLVVDHCHKTNKIRGILCNGCNAGLGMFRDNTQVLNEAILYLNKFYKELKNE